MVILHWENGRLRQTPGVLAAGAALIEEVKILVAGYEANPG